MDPTGIFGAIVISPRAFERFCHEHGQALVRDVNYILANRAIEQRYYDDLAEAVSKVPSTASMSSAFIAFQKGRPSLDSLYRKTPEGYLHSGSDELVVCYEPASQTLFYFYMLDRRHPDELEELPSFKALRAVVNYKDINSTDYVVLASSSTNFGAESVWRAFIVSQGGWRKQYDDADDDGNDPIPAAVEANLQRLSRTYYFNAVDMYLEIGPEPEGEAKPWVYPTDYLDPCLLKYVTEPAMSLD